MSTAPPPKPKSLGDILQEFAQHRLLMQQELQKVIVGQHEVIEQLFAAIFTRGHCLLEGVPGLAKTLMVSTLARILDVSFKRIQFTPDLMPSDITGTNVLEEDEAGQAEFPLRRRAGVHEHPAGRRNQPHAAQDAGRPAAGDAGARSDASAGRRTSCPIRSSRSPRRTRSSRKGPIRCPKPSSTGSCSTSRSAIPPPTRRKKSSRRRRGPKRSRSARFSPSRAIVNLQKLVHSVAVSEYIVKYVCAAGARHAAQGRNGPAVREGPRRLGAGPRAGQFLINGGKALAAMDGRFSVAIDDVKKDRRPRPPPPPQHQFSSAGRRDDDRGRHPAAGEGSEGAGSGEVCLGRAKTRGRRKISQARSHQSDQAARPARQFVVKGFLQGLHASPFHGFSVEFTEHRRYSHGDDPKDIDWLVFAKTDKYYVKKFEAETNITGYLAMDLSQSMGFTHRQELTKFDYAICLAASLVLPDGPSAGPGGPGHVRPAASAT